MKKFFATVLALCISLCVFAVPSSAKKHVKSDDGAVVVCNCQSKDKTRTRKQPSLLRVIGEGIKWVSIVVASAAGFGYACCLGVEGIDYLSGNVRENDGNIFRRAYKRFDMRVAIEVCDHILNASVNALHIATHESNYDHD